MKILNNCVINNRLSCKGAELPYYSEYKASKEAEQQLQRVMMTDLETGMDSLVNQARRRARRNLAKDDANNVAIALNRVQSTMSPQELNELPITYTKALLMLRAQQLYCNGVSQVISDCKENNGIELVHPVKNQALAAINANIAEIEPIIPGMPGHPLNIPEESLPVVNENIEEIRKKSQILKMPNFLIDIFEE